MGKETARYMAFCRLCRMATSESYSEEEAELRRATHEDVRGHIDSVLITREENRKRITKELGLVVEDEAHPFAVLPSDNQ